MLYVVLHGPSHRNSLPLRLPLLPLLLRDPGMVELLESRVGEGGRALLKESFSVAFFCEYVPDYHQSMLILDRLYLFPISGREDALPVCIRSR